MAKYDCVELARRLDERFEPEDLTRREFNEVAGLVLNLAQEIRDDLGLEDDDAVASFLGEQSAPDDDDFDDEDLEEDEEDGLDDEEDEGDFE